MIRTPAVVVAAVLIIAGCSSSSSTTSPPAAAPTTVAPTPTTTPRPPVDPCTLLTAQDATKLTGRPMKRSPLTGASDVVVCGYAAGASAGAEITVKVLADAAAAHEAFPDWVQPIPGHAAGLTTTSVPGLGNEASATHNLDVNDGIYVRRGATLVKIGAYPAVADAALLTAARTALARIRAAG